jgi:hypothetical protein
MNIKKVRKKLMKGEKFLSRKIGNLFQKIDNVLPQPSNALKLDVSKHKAEKKWSDWEMKFIEGVSS